MRCQRVVPSFVAFLCFVALSATNLKAQSTAPADDVWRPLRFLLGSWEGTISGQPGNGSGTREYRPVLSDRFIEVRSRSAYPPQEKNPKGETHEDVGYISFDRNRKAFIFRQFHSEGFVNIYVATPSAGNTLVFTSEAIENIPTGWRARETYRAVSEDEWLEVFELAEPGKAFTTYSETRLRRRQ